MFNARLIFQIVYKRGTQMVGGAGGVFVTIPQFLPAVTKYFFGEVS